MAYILTIAIFLVWIVLIAMMIRAVLKTPTCPECGSDRMESVDMRTSTITINGETVPAAWMYRRCHDCSARLKWDIGQDCWVELDPGEWEDVVRSAEDV